MEYKGRHTLFDSGKVKTYPVSGRNNKVKIPDIKDPGKVRDTRFDINPSVEYNISTLAKIIVKSRKRGMPVLFFTGAHLIKNGLGRLVCELIERDVFTVVSGNGATSIHDFELALFGETSEDVPDALEKGRFGMAYEFNFINAAISIGNRYKLGYGESIGEMINSKKFRDEVAMFLSNNDPISFSYPELSVQSTCHKKGIPFTVHAGIGTDVIDQHQYFDGCAKGGCSGRDFLIYTNEVGKLTNGGVVVNVGSAVTGPEVFLKAASMVSNTGLAPNNITTANFDIRPYYLGATNEGVAEYYFRDQKSIITRIPQVYKGSGLYIEGNQLSTIPVLYQKLIELT